MTWTIAVENVAGILEGEATIEPGLNAVRASNWQGKSSFVAAVKTALGVAHPLTEGETCGRVAVETPDRTVAVDLERRDGRVVTTGTPYLEDEYDRVRADLFACLDEDNAVRRAVREGENLESVLMRPLDFQNIDERIADRRRERERLESRLANAEEAAKRLPDAQETVTQLESEVERLRERRADLEGGADAGDGADGEDTDDHNDEGAATTPADEDTSGDAAAAVGSELARARADRQQAQTRVERLEQSVERTESRLAEKREELADIDVETGVDYADDLADAREDLQALKRDKEVLQSLYSALEMVLQEDRLDVVTDVTRDLTGDSLVCWTCGSEVARADVEEQVDALGERVASVRTRLDSARDTVEELEAKRERRAQAERRREDLEREIADLEEKLADDRASLESARERLADAADRVATHAESVDETVAEITDLESEIKYREAELDDAREELAQLEGRAEKRADLESDLESVEAELTELRNRKDRIKYEAREAFGEAMADVLSRFDTGFETARLTAEFDLVVARDGREASLDALSEGELELLGFVAALAGYESFDAAEATPVMLVDSVGGLADDNLHTLVEYLRERTEYLVFTVYPEYAAFDGTEIDPGEWDVAVDRQATRE